MTTEVNEKLAEEIEQAVEQSVNEETVISEGSKENVEIPSKSEEGDSTSDTQEDTQENIQEDTQQETQEDTESEDEPSDGDTLEDSEGDTLEEKTESLELSQDSIIRAMKNGLSFSEANSFSNNTVLNEFSSRIEFEVQKNAQFKVQQKNQESEKVNDPFVDFPKLDPESFDPEVIEMFNKLTGIVKGQSETIRSFQDSQDQIFSQNQELLRTSNQVEVERWFNEEVEGLGDDFKDVLGEGNYSSLDKNSSQFANRDAIASHMSILIAGYNSQGIAPPPKSEIFESAVRTVLSSKIGEIKDSKLSNKLRDQSTQQIQRANKSASFASKTPEEEDAELGELLDQKFG
ncbi:hypothetical protein LCGC14_1410000 [marine sediment metagenome]|uniref:Uncharacterized protein n=1 Tax=marine sediment metagenome TaxID=412755 RepID=A0A0F9MW66_9ZZZZ